MSSFSCQICGRQNIDSLEGYIKGCRHYPPERAGEYLLFKKTSTPIKHNLKVVNWNDPIFTTIEYWERYND